MITVNEVNLSNNGDTLYINVSTGVGYNITSIKLWNQDNFKNYETAKDLSYKLEQVNNNEIINYTATEVGYSNFSGIYFLEIETNQPSEDECSDCSNSLNIVLTNLAQYYKCMTELILKSEVCNNNLFSREVCDDNKINEAISVNLFIDAVNQCLELGQFSEAIILFNNLKKLCSKCTNCKTLSSDNRTVACTTCNQYIY